ncbi:MAG: hypothetical protein UW00_C0011G0001 [Parcubacteria group bacterium GW2011_GWB1_43_66]|nr:MAG: hypothetical protein UW00_C0011G0001 [Parcubacteria group bacterium GW2011_GWB1_43_66]
MDFASKKCVPCEGGMAPHTKEKVLEYLSAVPGWQADSEFKKLSREFTLKDFKAALKFINQIGEIAEAEGHHPSDNDFILAAKINQLWGNQVSAKA